MSRRKKTFGEVRFMTFFQFASSAERTRQFGGTECHYVIVPDEQLPEELREHTATEVLFRVYAIDSTPGEPTILYVEDIEVEDSTDNLLARGSQPLTPQQMPHGAQVYLCQQHSRDSRSFFLGRMTQGGQLLTSLSQRQKLKAKARQQETKGTICN